LPATVQRHSLTPSTSWTWNRHNEQNWRNPTVWPQKCVAHIPKQWAKFQAMQLRWQWVVGPVYVLNEDIKWWLIHNLQ
jgi:hypothetical protein